MRIQPAYCFVLFFGLSAMFMVGCSRDPNVRKQKYLESGERYWEKGKYPDAVIQFKNAIQVDSGYADAHYKLAQVYLAQQLWTPAFQELNRTVDLQPENYPARLGLTNLLIAARDFRNAQENLDFLLKNQPNNAEVHAAAADLFSAQEKLAPATEEAQNAIQLAPDRWQSYLKLATLQMRTNQPDLAEPNFRKAVELNPNEAVSRMALADYFQARGRWNDAELEIQHASDAEPANPGPRAALVRVYMIRGKYTEAETLLKNSRRDFPSNPIGYRLLGDFYFANLDYDGAVTEYAAICHEHPDDRRAQKNYIQLLIIKGRVADADKLNSEILKASPGDVEALIHQAQIQIHNHDAKAAISTLRTALRNDPANALAYYHLGVALQQVGDVGQAEGSWQTAARLSPDLTDAQLALAQSALRRGDMTALEQSASQIVRLLPKAPAGYAMRSLSFLKRGALPRAEQDALQAINLAPQAPDGYMQMGNLRTAQKRYPEAEKFYLQTLERDPGSSDALGSLTNVYLIEKQPEKALAAVKAQIKKMPDNSSFLDLLGTLEFEHRTPGTSLDAAESALSRSSELDKNNADAWLKLCQVQAARGDIDKAIATGKRALQDNPRETAFYVLLGRLYESKNDWEEAKQSYQAALEIDPRNPQASNNLAYALAQTGGNLDVALSLAQTARRGLPESFNAADTLGWVLYQRGAYKSAIDSFRDAVTLTEKTRSPESPNIRFHLGLAYQRVGESALARQQLERVLKISPNYSQAEDVRKALAQLRG